MKDEYAYAIVHALMMSLTKVNSGELPRAFVVLSAGAQKRVSGNAEASKKLQKDIADHVASKVVKYKALTGGVEFIEYVNVSKASCSFSYFKQRHSGESVGQTSQVSMHFYVREPS